MKKIIVLVVIIVIVEKSAIDQSHQALEEFRAPYHRRLRRGACEINQYEAS